MPQRRKGMLHKVTAVRWPKVEGQRAYVKVLSTAKKRELGFNPRQRIVCRTVKCGENMPAFSSALTLGNLLYPELFPKQIASGLQQGGGIVTYSIVVDVNEITKKGINSFYGIHGFGAEETYFSVLSVNIHRLNVRRRAKELQKKILEDSGIRINSHEANIGEKVNKGLVCFDIMDIDLNILKNKIRRIKNPLKRKQAINLFKELKRYSDSDGFIEVRV